MIILPYVGCIKYVPVSNKTQTFRYWEECNLIIPSYLECITYVAYSKKSQTYRYWEEDRMRCFKIMKQGSEQHHENRTQTVKTFSRGAVKTKSKLVYVQVKSFS